MSFTLSISRWSLCGKSIGFQMKLASLDSINDKERKLWEKSLIGKLFTSRKFDEVDIQNELVKSWNTNSKITITFLYKGLFKFCFEDEQELRFVLENGSWKGKKISYAELSSETGSGYSDEVLVEKMMVTDEGYLPSLVNEHVLNMDVTFSEASTNNSLPSGNSVIPDLTSDSPVRDPQWECV
ncbi:hypothetical protein IFM89_005981 [Coptis chinensis]|uniref:DUF4283 domain-containing protein n=1 Tax=Coptis chinensis TaxID=261450 RepID=A0A835M294_9MAGN|nr:hypothetical protein IFM89_005981 [Coptis chinensis]